MGGGEGCLRRGVGLLKSRSSGIVREAFLHANGSLQFSAIKGDN